MNDLQNMLDKFRNDNNWNTLNKDGSHRFDKEIEWIESMVKSYAEHFHMTPDEVAALMVEKRDYSWPNYYQKANFPPIGEGGLYGVFKTFEEFREYADKHYEGFKCPRCGDISYHPQECRHRIEKDGKCDWCAGGLFRSGKGVIILEDGFKMIPIFEPVEKGKT